MCLYNSLMEFEDNEEAIHRAGYDGRNRKRYADLPTEMTETGLEASLEFKDNAECSWGSSDEELLDKEGDSDGDDDDNGDEDMGPQKKKARKSNL